VACIEPGRLAGLPAEQAAALRALGVEIAEAPEIGDAELVVDALLGTGPSRPVEGRMAEWIAAIDACGRPVTSVDVPSGLDAETGRALGPCVRATVTVTLGLPKPGLLTADGPAHAGTVWVADIGIPTEAYAAVGLEVPPGLFAGSDCFELR
jgi:hydroxyethylthiazole kinase-like uncharacterized protein yjeF